MKITTITLDGKRIAFTDATQFLVQIGKGKGSYRTKYSFVGNIVQAYRYYSALNIGNGHKKRLYAPDLVKPVLARQFS
jgi:hypothetical protein